MYLTYAEYTSLGGEIDEVAFIRREFAASSEIDRATFGRLRKMQSVPNAVKMLVAELIDIDNEVSNSVQEERVETWSKTYKSASDLKQNKSDLIYAYLIDERDDNGIPLLYCGVR